MVATLRELLFCLFDHHMRHSVIKNMHAKIQKNPQAFEEFAKMVDSDEFRDMVVCTTEDPSSAVAKEVMSKILPVFHLVQQKMLWDPLVTQLQLAMPLQWKNIVDLKDLLL